LATKNFDRIIIWISWTFTDSTDW